MRAKPIIIPAVFVNKRRKHVLAFSFFVAVAISIAWLFGWGFYINLHFPDLNFMALSLNDAALYIIATLLPLFVMWSLWGHLRGWKHELMLQKEFALLSKQIHQNQEYSDVIARILLKNGQQQSHVYALGKIEMYIGEMNEILADILERCNLIGEKSISSLWKNVGYGNRWGFAKAFVDLYNNDADFENKLVTMARNNGILAGSITEFCARYNRLSGLLKEHDEENILQDVIETGAFGKVFSIFASAVRKMHEQEEEQKITAVAEEKPEEQKVSAEEKSEKSEKKNKKSKTKAEKPQKQKKHRSMWSKLFGGRKDDEEYSARTDPLTIALERSFGEGDSPSEPVVEEKSENIEAEKSAPEPEPEEVKPEEVELEKTEPEDAEPIVVEDKKKSEIETSELKFLLSDEDISEDDLEEDEDLEKDSEDTSFAKVESVNDETSNDLPEKEPVAEKSEENLQEEDAAPQTEEGGEAGSNKFAFSSTDEVLKDLQKEWDKLTKSGTEKEKASNE